jgi:Spy/CpxP family protein refolding chaperone
MSSRSSIMAIVCASILAVTGLSVSAQRDPSGRSMPQAPAPSPGGADDIPDPTLQARTTSSAAAKRLQPGPVGRWWDDRAVVKKIGLRKEQRKKMEFIFNANKPAIVASYKDYLCKQSKLDSMSKDPQVDQARLFSAIDAVSQARASLRKATTEMLLQIRQQMDPDQIAKLEKLR